MSVFAEATGSIGLSLTLFNLGYQINRRVNPREIYKYAEQRIENYNNEVMMGNLIEKDLISANHVEVLRQRAEHSLRVAANNLEKTSVWNIRVRFVTARTASIRSKKYETELKKRSAAAERLHNKKLLDDASRKSSNATSCLSNRTVSVCAVEGCPDHKSNSQSLVTSQIPPSSSSTGLITEERREVSSGRVGQLSVQVHKETIESVQRGDTLLVADVSRQNNQNDGSPDTLDPIMPSPNVVSENFTVIPPISIEESSNTINIDYSQLMNEILPMIHA